MFLPYINAIYTSIVVVLMFMLVPRKEIRKLVIYGMLFGAGFDIVAITIFTVLLHVGGFINFEPFGFHGFPFFPPLAWTAYYIMYFYILSANKNWKYLLPITGTFYSVIFSNVLQNLGVFKWNYGRTIIPFIIYITWYCLATWGYLKLTQKIQVRNQILNHIFRSDKPILLKRLHKDSAVNKKNQYND